MTKDAELIVELATKIMGAVVRTHDPAYSIPDKQTTEYRLPDQGLYLLIHSEDSPYIRKIEGWNPLESDCDVFMVVDAMEKFSCDFSLEKSGGNWTASFGGVSRTGTDRRRVICEAAMEACGG